MRYLRIFALVALCLAYAPTPAMAVTGYDSAYNSESAFVTIDPGETKGFQVFFINTGTLTWIKGSDSQVDLAACLEDKVSCNTQDASEAGWNSGWLSASRYATTTQASVAPNGVATFSYNIKAPADATGTHRFNGDLVVASSGARIHPEGYFQDAKVNAIGQTGPTPTPTPGSTPFPSAPPPTSTPAPTPAPPALTCFDGTTDTANGETQGFIYGGICTVTGARSATLNNVPPARDGAYSGVYFVPDSLKGDSLADVTSLSFSYTGASTSKGFRFSVPIDSDMGGAFDFYLFIDVLDCSDGAGNVNVITDATCTIYTSLDGTNAAATNWANLIAGHPSWRVSNSTTFIIADTEGAWNVSNVHIGN
jgi:hypothetical protein